MSIHEIRRAIPKDTAISNHIYFAKPYLEDIRYTEVAVNGPGKIWCFGSGGWTGYDSDVTDIDLQELASAIATYNGNHMSASNPILSQNIESMNLRVAMICPPVSRGHTLTIRKHSDSVPTAENMLQAGMWDTPVSESMDKKLDEMYSIICGPCATPQLRYEFCLAAIRDGKNTLFCGATGSGKTSMLNMFISQLDPAERLLVVEDVPEIRYASHPNSIGLLFTPSSKGGDNSVTPRECLGAAMRALPTRLIYGELRDGDKAAQEWLSACHTGHKGSMTTLHSGNVKQAYDRLIKMARQSDNPAPYEQAKEEVMDVVDLVIHIGFENGKRIITDIAYTP